MRYPLLFASIALTTCAPSFAASSGNPHLPGDTAADSRQAAVDTLFAGFNASTPGAAVGIYQNGKLVYARGYGMADLEAGTPITPHTRFHVASVSKQFTAFAVALLAREGKVELDADIRRYLPFVPDFGHVITVRHLILHTSGLRDQWELFGIGGQEIHNVLHQQQIINMISRQRALNFTPGMEHMYCNTGYTLLGEIVRVASHESLRQFTQERIFRPLGMTDTFFFDDVNEVVPGRAQSYARKGPDEPWKRDLLNYDNVGATSLLTTVEDLARWAGNFSRPLVGDRALIDQVSHNGTLDDGTPIRYGFGLERASLGGREIVTHNGSDAGFHTVFYYYPADDFAVAIATNTDFDPGAADLHLDLPGKVAAIAALYLPQSPAPTVLEIAQHADPTPIAGTYVEQYSHSLQLEVLDGALYRHTDTGPRKLVQRADGSFDTGMRQNNFFVPLKDDTGHVVAIEQHAVAGGRAMRFERVTPVTPDAAALTEFTGNYHSNELDITYTIAIESGRLVARSLWTTEPTVLTRVMADRFESAAGVLEIVVFDRDRHHRIKGLRVHGGRIRNLEMQRLPPHT